MAQHLLLLCTLRLQSNITQLVNMPTHWYSMPLNIPPICLYLTHFCSPIMLNQRNQMIHTRDSFCFIFSIMDSSLVGYPSQILGLTTLDLFNGVTMFSDIAFHILFLYIHRQYLFCACWRPHQKRVGGQPRFYCFRHDQLPICIWEQWLQLRRGAGGTQAMSK